MHGCYCRLTHLQRGELLQQGRRAPTGAVERAAERQEQQPHAGVAVGQRARLRLRHETIEQQQDCRRKGRAADPECAQRSAQHIWLCANATKAARVRRTAARQLLADARRLHHRSTLQYSDARSLQRGLQQRLQQIQKSRQPTRQRALMLNKLQPAPTIYSIQHGNHYTRQALGCKWARGQNAVKQKKAQLGLFEEITLFQFCQMSQQHHGQGEVFHNKQFQKLRKCRTRRCPHQASLNVERRCGLELFESSVMWEKEAAPQMTQPSSGPSNSQPTADGQLHVAGVLLRDALIFATAAPFVQATSMGMVELHQR